MIFKKTAKQSKTAPKKAVSKKETAASAELKIKSNRKVLIVKHPWISEKAYLLSQKRSYIFLVDKKAKKPEIKEAIKEIYKVDPVSVNTVSLKGKPSRYYRTVSKGAGIKKAIVELKEGQKLDIMPH